MAPFERLAFVSTVETIRPHLKALIFCQRYGSMLRYWMASQPLSSD